MPTYSLNVNGVDRTLWAFHPATLTDGERQASTSQTSWRDTIAIDLDSYRQLLP